MLRFFSREKNNLYKVERDALTVLTNNPNIEIQKADEVNTFVTLDKEFYFEKLVSFVMLCQKYINTKKFLKKLKNPMKVRSK